MWSYLSSQSCLILYFFLVYNSWYVKADPSEVLAQDMNDCREEFNITDEEMGRLASHEYPTTPEGKCFLKCMLVKSNIMEGGTMNADGAKALVEEIPKMSKEDKEKMKEAVNECASELQYVEGDDAMCENAVLISQCISKKAEEKNVKPPE